MGFPSSRASCLRRRPRRLLRPLSITRLPTAAVLLGAACFVVSACSRPAESDSHTQRQIRATDLDQVRLGVTSPAEIEHLFGAPDTRDGDGSVVYGVGSTAPTVTFHFEDGTVSRICQTRP